MCPPRPEGRRTRAACPQGAEGRRGLLVQAAVRRGAGGGGLSGGGARFHTVILVGIPKLGPENRNEAARFVQLIDALYEHKVKLLAAADAQPADLYETGDGRFEFERTISRLEEMRSEEYLAQGHGSEGLMNA